ncbi:MAG: hypothetical protein RR549_04305 [Oscillospiraceae bacterium]
MEIDFQRFLSTLPIMLNGMLGIFIVTGIIILVMLVLNKITDKTKNIQNKTQEKD